MANPEPIEEAAPSPTIRDAIRKELDDKVLHCLIRKRLQAILRRKLREAGLPVLPDGTVNVVEPAR